MGTVIVAAAAMRKAIQAQRAVGESRVARGRAKRAGFLMVRPQDWSKPDEEDSCASEWGSDPTLARLATLVDLLQFGPVVPDGDGGSQEAQRIEPFEISRGGFGKERRGENGEEWDEIARQ